MRLDDPTDEHGAAVADAAAAGPRTSDRVRRYLELVHDAEQAHRPWATDELAAIEHAGASARFKRLWKPEPKPVPVGKISVEVQTVVGVERDGEWLQLPIGQLSILEMDVLVKDRIDERDRQTGRLVVLRRIKQYVAENVGDLGPDALIEDVLRATGADLLDVMAGAA